MITVREAKRIAKEWVEAEAPILRSHLPNNLRSAVILNYTPRGALCYIDKPVRTLALAYPGMDYTSGCGLCPYSNRGLRICGSHLRGM